MPPPSFSTEGIHMRKGGPVRAVRVAATRADLADGGCCQEAFALIDTGARDSILSIGLVRRLGLVPHGTGVLRSADNTNHNARLFSVVIGFGPWAVFEVASAGELNIGEQGYDVLIGRDILAHGVLVYMGTMNQFTLTFPGN
jgi:hypothetical protein